ncbi:MAG: metallophosphoesterase [Clostridia bacterium]|nr:metallophosphoesterase [Clostridia bacterium]
MWIEGIADSGVKVRDVTVQTDKGGEDIEIIHLTDLHLSWANGADLEDTLVADTYRSRAWSRDGKFLSNAERCLDLGRNADRIVITGDIYDYLTSETAAQVCKLVFGAYGNIAACLGNHDIVKAMGEERVWTEQTVSERLETVKESWINDIYYFSEVLGDKVMLILMDNGSTGNFWDSQVPLFTADLEAARAGGYAVLLFYHIPISTGNAKYKRTLTLDKGQIETKNFYNSYADTIWSGSEGASGKIYDLIVRNGDIIKGAFCGHLHSDFYTEIDSSAPDGFPTVIPQYILKSTAFEHGHALRITVK